MNAPAEQLQNGLEQMVNRYGFTSVVDTGSYLPNTLALRARVESGELRGPRIRTTGAGFVPAGGSPAYLDVRLPELDSADAAVRRVTETLDSGVDALKLFTGTFLSVSNVAVMPDDVVAAAVGVAHQREKLVIAHPQSLAGVRAALAGGVDILAHTAPGEGPWPEDLLDGLMARRTVLVPTLALWRFELSRQDVPVPPAIIDRYEQDAIGQASTFVSRGGLMLFGTDVGYTNQYDPTEEYRLLAEAGLTHDQVTGLADHEPRTGMGRRRRRHAACGWPRRSHTAGRRPTSGSAELRASAGSRPRRTRRFRPSEELAARYGGRTGDAFPAAASFFRAVFSEQNRPYRARP